MERIKKSIVTILFNLFLAIVGFIFMVNPQVGIDYTRYYLGISLLLIAIVPFYVFISGTNRSFTELIKGILLVLAGMFFIFNQQGSTYTFAVALLIWMISSTLIKFALARRYKEIFNRTWWWMLIFGAIMLGATIYVALNLSASLSLIIITSGFFMIVEAIAGIIGILFFYNSNK